jgi:SAM-dependent methyltransferase
MPIDYFGADVAETYDESLEEMADPATIAQTVEVLSDLAGAGAALELGIGTGRIAIPLSRGGVRVHGIDLSEAMLARLRAKPDARGITVTVGDFASTRLTETFALAYLVFNTIMNLTTQDEQVAAFQTVSRHLEPGGHFVIEVGVPDLQRLPRGETVKPFAVTPTALGFDEYDVATQRLVSHHYEVGDGGVRSSSIPFRYVWPSELDLMARIAGLRLRERWSDWSGAPFTALSTSHVSVWRKI